MWEVRMCEPLPAILQMRFRNTHMPHKRNQTLQSLPVANYGPAIAKAVEWLGRRYLLAKPINARREPRSETTNATT